MDEADEQDRITRLEARIRLLEAQVTDLMVAGSVAASGEEVAGAVLPPPPPPEAMLPPPPHRAAPAETTPPRSVIVDSETALKWGGVVLVVLAIGFAVSTAISRGWIGPELQLAGALLASAALIVVGLRLERSRPAWTQAMCLGGVAGLFATAASNLMIDQAGENAGRALTVATAIGAYALAQRIPSQWVGGGGLVGGLSTWVAVSRGEPPFAATWTWSLTLVAAAFAVSLHSRWHAVRTVTQILALAAALSMGAEADTDAQVLMTLAFAALATAALVRLPSVGDKSSGWQRFEIQLAVVSGPWLTGLLVAVFEVDSDSMLGVTGLLGAAVIALAAAAVRRQIDQIHYVSLATGSSIALSIGLAFLLSPQWAQVALGLQALLLVAASRSVQDVRVYVNAGVLVFISGSFAADAMVTAWRYDAPILDDIAHLLIAAAIVGAGMLVGRRDFVPVTLAAGIAGAMLWLGSVLVHLPQGQAIVSISWAVIGTLVLIAGAVRRSPEAASAGLTVIGVTVAKLLTVDLQEVDTLWRAGLFFLIGAAIMRLGFLLPRLMSRPR